MWKVVHQLGIRKEEPELSFNHLTELENNIHLFPVGFCPIACDVLGHPFSHWFFFPVNNLKILPPHGVVLTLVETSSNPTWSLREFGITKDDTQLRTSTYLYTPENNVKVVSSRYPSNHIQQVLTTLSPGRLCRHNNGFLQTASLLERSKGTTTWSHSW